MKFAKPSEFPGEPCIATSMRIKRKRAKLLASKGPKLCNERQALWMFLITEKWLSLKLSALGCFEQEKVLVRRNPTAHSFWTGSSLTFLEDLSVNSGPGVGKWVGGASTAVT